MTNKQAVVVIHGMGEQKPMGTLRAFVETIWQKDRSLTAGDADNPFWIRPDARAGLHELRRITTPPIRPNPEAEPGRRTDFYEFYWADLMQGTTWQHLLSWVRGLLFRSPATVPWNVFAVWICLWIVTFAVVIASLSTMFGLDLDSLDRKSDPPPAGLINDWYWWFFDGLRSFILCLGNWFRPVAYYLLWILGLFAIWALFPWRSLLQARNWLSLPIIAALFIAGYFFAELVVRKEIAGAAFSVLTALLAHNFLVPYFGDVARYVEASPANVQNRRAVRSRGLKLLRELHECGEYNRIIIVAHSLGTIVAYDLITLLWAEHGPDRGNPPAEGAEQQLLELDTYLQNVKSGKDRWDLNAFRARQRTISKALTEPGPGVGEPPSDPKTWLISDLVTLGSPLTHAEFLLADDDRKFDKLIEERVLSSCPPLLTPRTEKGLEDQYSFLYAAPDSALRFPHHASCFAAVRWTNIHDAPHPLTFLFGDVISGRVSEHFGYRYQQGKRQIITSGIIEEKADIFWGTLNIPRLFTHTKYWQWHQTWENDGVPDYITKLRDAVNLAGD